VPASRPTGRSCRSPSCLLLLLLLLVVLAGPRLCCVVLCWAKGWCAVVVRPPDKKRNGMGGGSSLMRVCLGEKRGRLNSARRSCLLVLVSWGVIRREEACVGGRITGETPRADAARRAGTTFRGDPASGPNRPKSPGHNELGRCGSSAAGNCPLSVGDMSPLKNLVFTRKKDGQVTPQKTNRTILSHCLTMCRAVATMHSLLPLISLCQQPSVEQYDLNSLENHQYCPCCF
jgi:hypothetical protein